MEISGARDPADSAAVEAGRRVEEPSAGEEIALEVSECYVVWTSVRVGYGHRCRRLRVRRSRSYPRRLVYENLYIYIYDIYMGIFMRL